MGGGSWTSKAVNDYVYSVRSCSLNDWETMSLSSQDVFVQSHLHPDLDPKNIVRECHNSEEHPNTIPVILALDVTGSMGHAAVEVAQRLNTIMSELYESVADVEFCIMGIGDLAYDHAPIQMSQFESDVRIMEHLDKVYFEYGGGGNSYESYTAAWYMGARHTDLHCWGQGRKGIIITIGDECPNPYLPKSELMSATGDTLQAQIETEDLLAEVSEKYDVYHLAVDDSSWKRHKQWHHADTKWRDLLGDNFYEVTLDNLAEVIVSIVSNNGNVETATEGVTW